MGTAKKKPGPTTTQTGKKPGSQGRLIPPLLPWANDTPYELAFSKAMLWERIQCGLELSDAVQALSLNHRLEFEKGLVFSNPSQALDRFVLPNAGSLSSYLNESTSPQFQQTLKQVLEVYNRYDDVCEQEFDEIEDDITVILAEVAYETAYGDAKGRGLFKKAQESERTELAEKYYKWLRPYYYVEGIDHPPEALNAVKTGVRFLGKNVGAAHPDLIQVLQLAEKKIAALGMDGYLAVVNGIKGAWAFQPRPQGTLNALSNHALGKAIDIDPSTNPLILENAALQIDKVLDFLGVQQRLSQSLYQAGNLCDTPGAQAKKVYQNMKVISDALQQFLRDWLEPWKQMVDQKAASDQKLASWKKHPKQKPTDAQEVEKVTKDSEIAANELAKNPQLVHMGILVNAVGGYKTAKVYQAKGMLTIPLQIYQAMSEAGAELGIHERSGLDYAHRKDVMHFEVNWVSKRPRRYLGKKRPFKEIAFRAGD